MISYVVFAYLWFGILYLNLFHELTINAKLVISLFSMGALGGTLYCSIYYSHEYNSALNDDIKLNTKPYYLDFIGYIIYFIRSGIIGVIFYFIFKAGIFIIINDNEININDFAKWLIAFSGGFSNPKIIKFLESFVNETLDPKNKNNKPIIDAPK